VLDFVATPLEDTLSVRAEVIDTCRKLHELGHFIGTWGNISVRLTDGMLVTPSAVAYETMTTDDLVLISWGEMKVIKGERLPSSESLLHHMLLSQRADFGAVVHTHSHYLTALSCARRDLPTCVEDMAQIIGGDVKCTSYVPGSKHKELAEAACDAIGKQSMAVLLANHGPVLAARTLAEAVVAVEILEKAAMSFVLASSIGGCVLIPEDNVKEERERFLFKYGKTVDGALG
jgi:L-fuculose-phosphate aldolase